MKKVGNIKREYSTSPHVFDALYGKKKGKILRLLLEEPQQAKQLIEISGLSPSAVYHFLKVLKKRHLISKKGALYYVEEFDFNSLFLDEIVQLEEDPTLRRKYGISIKELELAYFLWDTFQAVSDTESYGRTYNSIYTLADAVHRWRTGRTDIPVWALTTLEDLSGVDALSQERVIQYHLPPGIPVTPFYQGEYKLPVVVDNDLNKIVVQLLQKMSKNHMYTFPKKRGWLFEMLHKTFGEFDDSNSRIPSAITEVLKCHYNIKTLDRSIACIPSSMQDRWMQLDPLSRAAEKASLLLHIISLSSRSNGGFEITSRSKSFLEEISCLSSELGVGKLTVRKKHKRPHFRVYLSEGKVDILRRYAHIFQNYPDLTVWLRIPLNRIAETLILTEVDAAAVERICYKELSQFTESILKSLERKKRSGMNFLQYKEEITDYFWHNRIIPSLRSVEELVELQGSKEEPLLYVV
jgi:DNA-binding transcriptional ArsR family regulator